MNAYPEGGAAQSPPTDLPEDSFGAIVGHDEGAEHIVAAAAPISSPILDRLRQRYELSKKDRRKTLMILPGRYDNMLAVRLMPISDEERQKRAPKLMRAAQSGNEEAALNAAAELIVAATETILLRDEDGELKPMGEVVDQYQGQEPVGWDERLLSAVGLDVPAEMVTPERVLRMVWSNKAAINGAVQALQAFMTEDDPGDEGDVPDPS